MGASSDGVVSCDCHGTGVCEIKGVSESTGRILMNTGVMVCAELTPVCVEFLCVQVGVSGEQLLLISSSVVRGFKECRDNTSALDDYSVLGTFHSSAKLPPPSQRLTESSCSPARHLPLTACSPTPTCHQYNLDSGAQLPAISSASRPTNSASLAVPSSQTLSKYLETNFIRTSRIPFNICITHPTLINNFTHLLPVCDSACRGSKDFNPT
nr:uncharacterized protein LOC129154327 [Nothobranchius furzeri]